MSLGRYRTGEEPGMTETPTYNVTVLREPKCWFASIHHSDGSHDEFELTERGEMDRVIREVLRHRLGHSDFRVVLADCFRCEGCGGVYRRSNPEAEVGWEKLVNYPDDPTPDEDYASVCDGCYDKLMAMGGPR